MKKTIILSAVMSLLSLITLEAQKKYDDIYIGMSNMTLDQQYTELMDFQRREPYFANTYIQLGVICKNIMILTDPLRDIESAQFWANNAALFFGNYKVFYKDGEERSNSDYYVNLKIPQAGKKLTKEEVFAFVAKNQTLCQNFKDSTLLAYQAIEKSKMYYNRCITTFMSICEKYTNQNEALLQYDDQLQKVLDGLGNDIDSCVAAFKVYKAVLKNYPIMNYRQLYDFKTIETFRLDGITNSNFYDNRFTMWDYRKWIAEYEKILKEDILPLREMVSSIDDKFKAGKQEFESKGVMIEGAKPAYDDLFVFRLGRYDNNSLVRELFAYMEARRQLMQMACDSVILPLDTMEIKVNRKMRHLYRMVQLEGDVQKKLDIAKSMVTPERVVRFKDFFAERYGGESGLKSVLDSEKEYLHGIMTKALTEFGTYYKAVEASRDTLVLMKPNYYPKLFVRNSEGRVEYVAGNKKESSVCFVAKLDQDGKPIWATDIRKTQEVTSLNVTSDGVVVTVRQNEMPNALVYSFDGKQKHVYGISEGQPTCLKYNDISKVSYICHDISESQSSIAKLDSIGGKIWDIALEQINSIEDVIEIDRERLLLIGKKEGVSQLVMVGTDGVVGDVNEYFATARLNIKVIYRASAEEICLACLSEAGEMCYVMVDSKGQVVYSTKR